jgi:Bacterial protein of unknown function (DUF899)
MDTKTPISEKRKPISEHPILSREEWLALRKDLLSKEKELTRLRDQLNEERRELPWVRVEKKIRLRRSRGKGILDGPLRRTQPAAYLPLHVWTGLERGLPELLLHV